MTVVDGFVRSGKVRDLYALGDDRLLLVASDRLSAFDVVLPTPVPDKGRVLTGLSRFWFAATGIDRPESSARRRCVGAGSSARCPVDPVDLRGRSMICRRAQVLPIEVIVRGLPGRLGLEGLPTHPGDRRAATAGRGCVRAIALPEPILTPSTKAESGSHDENIDLSAMVDRLAGRRRRSPSRPLGLRGRGRPDRADPVDRAIALYRFGAAVAARAGILLADTKFEFGLLPGGQLLLIDEALTPDSSRFWDAATYEPGRAQASYDKQYVRDWLETQPWDKTAPGPALPADVVDGTRARYVEAFERITGATFTRYLQEDVIAR